MERDNKVNNDMKNNDIEKLEDWAKRILKEMLKDA